MGSLPQARLTVEEYVELERQSGEKFEYFDGHAYPMGVESVAHAFIQANLLRHLGNLLDGSGFRALGSDLHVETSAFYCTHPDVTVVGPSANWQRGIAVTNPVVLFEVLSPSSRRHDQIGKLSLYREIASLEVYVLVEQERCLVDCHRRMADGQWELIRYVGETAELPLTSLCVSVPLSLIYRDVPFELAEREPERGEMMTAEKWVALERGRVGTWEC